MKNESLSQSYTNKDSYISIFIVFFVSFIYLYGVAMLAREHLLIEMTVSILFPLVCIGFKIDKQFFPRVKQLFYIESSFNVLVVMSIVFVTSGISLNSVCTWGFLFFFVIQILGFLAAQKSRKSYLGILQTLLGFILLLIWFFQIENNHSVVDSEGRFLMWGEEAPLAIRLVYTIWILNVLLLESRLLPKMSQAIAHLSSIVLSWYLGEFFHVRLLTACHLFMLDGIFGYSHADALGPKFCQMPEKLYEKFVKWKLFVQKLSFVFTVTIFALSITHGLDLKGIF